MLSASMLSLLWSSIDYKAFLISSGICFTIGALFFLVKTPSKIIRKREGYLIVGMGWITICLLGALPYCIQLDINVVDAIFESTSGFTTTGATIFNDIESLSPGILFWRSLTQWIGGMGIIVFTIAIFPLLGIGGVELFVAEAPGPSADKIHPQIKGVAKRLWLIYIGLTFTLFLTLYFISGMTQFDALNHALTTMSTGGFSTKNASIAHFDSEWVQYPILIFMFIAGMNYTIIYFLFKGRIKKAWQSDELKFYLKIVFSLIILVGISIYYSTDYSVEKSFRSAAFQIVSLITTTGYITDDYTSWNNTLVMVFFSLLFLGACAGSTSGGIKMIRHLVFIRNSLLEFKRLLHPKAYIRVKIDQSIVSGRIITHILVFLLFYLIVFVGGSFIMMTLLKFDSRPFLTSIGSVATCLGNVGPGIGSVGPMDNFAAIPSIGKLLLSFIMIVGRLELFTILIILTPFFWKIN